MERLFHDDDCRHVDALLVAVETRQLDRCLVRFATGVAEKDFLHSGDCAQFVRQLLLLANPVEIGDVEHAADLFRDGLHQHRMLVSERVHRDAGQAVEIGLASNIGDATAFAVTESYGKPCVGMH